MFSNMVEQAKTYKAKEHVKDDLAYVENNLAMLGKYFKKHFLADDKLIAKYEGVRDPFHKTPKELTIHEGEKFIDFTTSDKAKKEFRKKISIRILGRRRG